MIITISMDEAGRIVLPKPMREQLQLRAGDSLELESSEDQVVLRPAQGRSHMYKEHGVWVFDSGEALTVETVNKTIRRVRGNVVAIWAVIGPDIAKRVQTP